MALGLVDESVYYIQSDYAGDPRQFYFGAKRAQRVQTLGTMNRRNYVKLVHGEKDQLMDERVAERLEKDRCESGDKLSEGYTYGFDEMRGGLNPGELGGGGGAITFNSPWRPRPTERSASMGDLTMAAAAPAVPGNSFSRMREEMIDKLPAHEPAVQVRSDFRSTIFWQPDIVTDKEGTAVVKVKYPDSLTGWKATARAVTEGNQFGIADAVVRTKQPLIVRLETPRFFVVGDQGDDFRRGEQQHRNPADVKVALESQT